MKTKTILYSKTEFHLQMGQLVYWNDIPTERIPVRTKIPSERKPITTKFLVLLNRKMFLFWWDFVLTGRPRLYSVGWRCRQTSFSVR